MEILFHLVSEIDWECIKIAKLVTLIQHEEVNLLIFTMLFRQDMQMEK